MCHEWKLIGCAHSFPDVNNKQKQHNNWIWGKIYDKKKKNTNEAILVVVRIEFENRKFHFVEWIIECVWQRKDGASPLTFTSWTFSFALEMRVGDDKKPGRYKPKWFHEKIKEFFIASCAFR